MLLLLLLTLVLLMCIKIKVTIVVLIVTVYDAIISLSAIPNATNTVIVVVGLLFRGFLQRGCSVHQQGWAA